MQKSDAYLCSTAHLGLCNLLQDFHDSPIINEVSKEALSFSLLCLQHEKLNELYSMSVCANLFFSRPEKPLWAVCSMQYLGVRHDTVRAASYSKKYVFNSCNPFDVM